MLAGSIFIAASIAAVGLDDDDDDAAIDLPTTTLTTDDDDDGPSTTLRRPGTSTTVVPAPSTTVAPQPTTTAAGGPTTTAAPPAETCGNGSVRGEPRAGEVTQEGDQYSMPLNALVVSDFDRPIVVTRLALQVTYEDASSELVEIDTGGVVIQPGQAHTYQGPTVTSDSRPTQITVFELAYQPEGRPDCNSAG